MEEQLRQEISEKAYTETLQDLRSKAKITMPGNSGIQRVQ